MERMIILTEKDYQELIDKNVALKEENKNLKRELEDTKQVSERDYNIVQNDNNILRNENKKLKEYNGELLENHKKDIDVLCEENRKLKKYYDRDKEELMESCYGLAKENDKLKSDLAYERTMLDNVKAEYKSLQNVIKNLKEELGEYKKMFEDQLKEGYIKNTAEFLDKKFPKVNGFMEEDTLQELKDIGEL